MKEQKTSAIAVACLFLSSAFAFPFAFAFPKRLIFIRSYIRPVCLPASLPACFVLFSVLTTQGTENFTIYNNFFYNMLCSNTVTVVKSRKSKRNRKRKRSPSSINSKEWPDDWLCIVFYIHISFLVCQKRQKNEKCWVFFLHFCCSFWVRKRTYAEYRMTAAAFLYPVSKKQINTCYVKANAF